MAWMIACLLAVFVSTPLLDSVMCRGEALNGAAAAGATDVVVVGDPRDGASAESLPDAHPNEGGHSVCFHGHCHHGGVATPAVDSDVVRVRLLADAGLPAATALLHSADLTHAKPPPRA